MQSFPFLSRRRFFERSIALGAAATLGPAVTRAAGTASALKTIRVGVIGGGSVSRMYFPHPAACPHVELVSACDSIPERAGRAAEKFRIPNHYPGIAPMLAGAPFDLLVNLTDMQEHEHLNREAIEAGKHVWSEKPIANSLAAGQEIGRAHV